MRIGICTPFDPTAIVDLLDSKSQDLLTLFSGVAATTVTSLVRELIKKGHYISIFSLDPTVREPVYLSGNQISIYMLPKRRSRYCMLDAYRNEIRIICKYVAIDCPEVLSAQWTYDHALGALSCGIPTIVTCHDTPLKCAWICKNAYMTYHLFIAAWVIRKAKQMICVSPYTVNHIKSIFRPKGTISLIPNGLESDVFERGKKRLSLPRLPSKNYTICSIGSWGNLKNIKELIKAFSIYVTKNHMNLRLVLYGRGLAKDEAAEKWARSHGIDSRIEFRGYASREHLLDFLQHEADLMVHPSKVETHGMVLVEAMACGVPVIGGRNSGAVSWTLDEGKSGVLCDIHSSIDIRSAIQQVIEHPEETKAMVIRAWESVNQRFRIEDVAKAHEDLLIKSANEAHSG